MWSLWDSIKREASGQLSGGKAEVKDIIKLAKSGDGAGDSNLSPNTGRKTLPLHKQITSHSMKLLYETC